MFMSSRDFKMKLYLQYIDYVLTLTVNVLMIELQRRKKVLLKFLRRKYL